MASPTPRLAPELISKPAGASTLIYADLQVCVSTFTSSGQTRGRLPFQTTTVSILSSPLIWILETLTLCGR